MLVSIFWPIDSIYEKFAIKTSIIAFIGNGVVDVKAFCGEAGMQGVLSKPLTREQAESVWRRYEKGEAVHVPGLMLINE